MLHITIHLFIGLRMNLNPNLSKTEAVVEWISERIKQQVYATGQRVPSIRGLAKQLNVSPFTVNQAYEKLVAIGKIQPKQGSGYFVNPPMTTTITAKIYTDRDDKPINTAWLMQHLFGSKNDSHSPGSGALPQDWLRYERMPTVAKQISSNIHSFIYQQSDIQGYLPLRELYYRKLYSLGISSNPNRLITTEGVSSAITLVARYLLQTGDAVIVDNPGWFWLIANLQARGLRVFGVDRDPEGPDIKQLKYLLQIKKAKLYVTNSVLQNPTGYNIHPSRAFQVLNLLHEHNAYLFEDDIYGAFDNETPALRYAALDPERVFYATGVSKILGSNWRQGIISCPDNHLEGVLQSKMLTQMNCSELSERIVQALLTDSSYRKQINALKHRLYLAHERMQKELPKFGFSYPNNTRSGFFLWLDTGKDSNQLAIDAGKAGWLVAPGKLFYPQQLASTHIRINVARTDQKFLFWLANYST